MREPLSLTWAQLTGGRRIDDIDGRRIAIGD
jgi:hypothetical protein